MFAALVTLLPALRLPTFLVVQKAGVGQFAIDSCVEAVQIYFPCKSPVQATNHTCLCEQYLWRVSCFDEHATTSSSSYPGRDTTDANAIRYCRAAGSFGANIIQRNQRLHGRQIESVISSIAGEVTSILASNDITVPTAIITSAINGVVQTLEPSASAADVTTFASSMEATVSSAATAPPSRSIIATHASTAASAESTATSPSSSRPFTGIIVGAVVGGVAALALLGILIMLILRHSKRKSTPHTPTDKEANPTTSSSYSDPNRSPTLVNESPHILAATPRSFPGAPLTTDTVVGAGAVGHNANTFIPHTSHQQIQHQHHNPHTEEKIAFHMQPQHPRENEMATNANVWEIDGREMQHPQELESPNVTHAYQPSPWENRRIGDGEQRPCHTRGFVVCGGRAAREDEYFGSPISPVSPIESRRF